MDDTKQLIEKYKRELMELSKTNSNSRRDTQANNTETRSVGETKPSSEVQPPRSPDNPTAERIDKTDITSRVIGYAGSPEAAEKYDRVLKELSEADVPSAEKMSENSAAQAPAPQCVSAENASCSAENDPPVTVGDPSMTTSPVTANNSTEDTPVKNSNIFTGRDEITDMDDSVFGSPVPLDPDDLIQPREQNGASPERPDDTASIDDEIISVDIASEEGEDPASASGNTGDTTPEADARNAPQNETDEKNGSRTQPVDYPETVYTGIDDFEEKNIGRGTIVFRTFAARQAFPISGVKITVSKTFNNEMFEIASLETDSSGSTRPLTLPAPSRELSQNAENEIQPFALYDATVFKEGFAKVSLYDIPVFDGIESVQKISMIPIAIQNNGTGNAPTTENITEQITEVPNADN